MLIEDLRKLPTQVLGHLTSQGNYFSFSEEAGRIKSLSRFWFLSKTLTFSECPSQRRAPDGSVFSGGDYACSLLYISIRNMLKLVLQCPKRDRKIMSDYHRGSIIYSLEKK